MTQQKQFPVCNAFVTVVFFSTVIPRTTSLRAPVREYAGPVNPAQAVLIDPYEVSKGILLSPSNSNEESSEVITPNSESPTAEEMPTPSALMKKPTTFRPKFYRDSLKNSTKLQNRLMELQSRTPFLRKRLGSLGLSNHGLYSGIARLGAGSVSLPSLKRKPGMSRRRTASGVLPSGITKNNVIHFLRNNRNLTTTTVQPTTDFLSRWHNSFSRGKPEEGNAQSQTKKHPIDEIITNKKTTAQSTAGPGNDNFSDNFKSKVSGNERTNPAMTSPSGITSVHDMTSTHFANGTSSPNNNKPAVQTESQNKMRSTTISPNRKKSSSPTSLSKELDKSVLHDTEILESIKSIVKSASGNTKEFSLQNFHGNTPPESLDMFTGAKPSYGFRPSYQEQSNTNQSIHKFEEQASFFSLTGSPDTRINARQPNRPNTGPNVNSGQTIVVSPPPLRHNLALQVGQSRPVITAKPKDSGYQKIQTREEYTDIVIGRPAASIQPPPVTIPTTHIPATLRNAEGSPIYIGDDNDQQYLSNDHPNIGSKLPPWHTHELGPLLDAISKKYGPYELYTTLNSATNLKALVESGKIPEFFKNENLMEYIKRDQLRFQPPPSVERLGKPISGDKAELEVEEKESGITGQFVALSGLALLMALGGYFLFSSSESVSESRGAPDPLLLAVNQAKHGLKLLQQGLDEYETKLIENKDRLNQGTPGHKVFETDQPLHDTTMDLGKIWKNIQEIPNRLLFSEESPFSNVANIIKEQLGDTENLFDTIKNTLMDSLLKTNPLSREPHSLHGLDSSTAENNKWNPLKILALDLISKLGLPSESSGEGNDEMRSFGKQWKFFSTLFLPTPAKNVSDDSEPELMIHDKVGDEKEMNNLDLIKEELDHSQDESRLDVEEQETETDNERREGLNNRSKKPLPTYKDTKMSKKQANAEDGKEDQNLKKYKNISNDLKRRKGEYNAKNINDDETNIKEEFLQSSTEDYGEAELTDDPNITGEFPQSSTVNYDDLELTHEPNINEDFTHSSIEDYDDIELIDESTTKEEFHRHSTRNYDDSELTDEPNMNEEFTQSSTEDYEDKEITDDPNIQGEFSQHSTRNYDDSELTDEPNMNEEFSKSSTEDYSDSEPIDESNVLEESIQSSTEDYDETDQTDDPNINGESSQHSTGYYDDSELTDEPNIKEELPQLSNKDYYDSEPNDELNKEDEFPLPSLEDYDESELIDEFPQSSIDSEPFNESNMKEEFDVKSESNTEDDTGPIVDKENFPSNDVSTIDELNFEDKLNYGKLRSPSDDMDKVEADIVDQPSDGSENSLRANENSSQVEESLQDNFSDDHEGSLTYSDKGLNFTAQSTMDNAQTPSKDSNKETKLKSQSRKRNENASSPTAESSKTKLSLSENSNEGDQNMKFSLTDMPTKIIEDLLKNSNASIKSELELKDRSTAAVESHPDPINDSENNDLNFKGKPYNTTEEDIQNKKKSVRNYLLISKDESKTGKQGNLDINNNGKTAQEDSPNTEIKMSTQTDVSGKEIGTRPVVNHGKDNGSDVESSKSENDNSQQKEKGKIKDKTLKSPGRSKDISSHDHESKEGKFTTASLTAKSQEVSLPEEESITEYAYEEEEEEEEAIIMTVKVLFLLILQASLRGQASQAAGIRQFGPYGRYTSPSDFVTSGYGNSLLSNDVQQNSNIWHQGNQNSYEDNMHQSLMVNHNFDGKLVLKLSRFSTKCEQLLQRHEQRMFGSGFGKKTLDVYSIFAIGMFAAFIAYIVYFFISVESGGEGGRAGGGGGGGGGATSFGISREGDLLVILSDVTDAFARWAVFESKQDDQHINEEDLTLNS
ncbi:uro-adherence factor A-like [Palaemon carinicauda]|uniref:uro-adherence factor A-like n=1 Tax=Palaemon carinicauda TaxID=392227 RepID=UPI0035B5CE87